VGADAVADEARVTGDDRPEWISPDCRGHARNGYRTCWEHAYPEMSA
jgi:hypothetical protein